MMSTLITVVDKLGLKSAPYISNTYCQNSVSSYGIAIECGYCTNNDTQGKQTCHISKISMNNAGLTAVIPEEMGGFRYLYSLILSNNDLHGPIPVTLGNLINLRTLDSRNQMTGSIPETLGSLQNLRWLYLQYNLLDSTIPRALGSLLNRKELHLHFNRLSGSIPDELGNVVNLTYMSLSENRLTGRLPDALTNLSSLRGFWVASNSLSDTFPESYGQLTSLKYFSIAGNYISGPLPVDIIKNWANVETLTLVGNNFKGNLTKEVFNLPNLQYLLISDLGNATFELPSEITNTKFISLILRNCSINGSIPKYIGQMPSLKYLDLSFNNLTGGLPEYMKSDVRYMSFSTNMLNGTIPDWILQADQTRIDLSFNNLTALDSGLPPNQDLNLFACCRNSSATSEPEIMYMRDPLDMMNTYCQGKEQKYHSLFINCGGGETVVNGITYDQDNDTSRYYTSPKKNWAYSSSGYFFNSSDYTKNMTCGVSVAEAPLYDRARLSPVSLKYYAFCLREGTYNVTLKFAEIVYSEDTDYTGLRKRAFDVYIQDDKVLHNFNTIKQARGPNKPITKIFTAVVSKNNSLLMIHMYWDGKGSTEYPSTFNGPLISAISVTPDFKIDDEKLRPLHIALIAIASTIIGMLLLLAFSWSMGWLGSRNSRKIKVGEEKTDEGTQEIRVTLKDLIDATGKFRDKKRIIGIGSLGTVYEAQLQVALSVDPNIRSVKFTWNTRLNICLGIARGLEYLHNHPSLKYYSFEY
ncbi:hypothetical protein M0R45_026035 [Rubus argutus]|uniref:non-specific serine/threonine protein kinase n=1 Tax=Rubus argutus TaxID=59490 RepID=A0AAW1WZY4_RUBAR